MLKPLLLNTDYAFALDGSYALRGKRYPAVVGNGGIDSIDIPIGERSYRFDRIWLGLLCHYEVDLPVIDASWIEFVSMTSRVIKLRCGSLMVFSRPIERPDGYRVIPGFTRFVVNADGQVKSVKTGKVLKPAIGPYGYPYVNIYDPDKGKWRSVSVHILVARTFVKNDDPEAKPFVNHIDGNKLNFSPRNLEWVTSLENQKHAVKNGLRFDNRQCRVYDAMTKTVTHHVSIVEALKSVGGHRSSGLYRRINGLVIPRLFFNRYEIKSADDSSDWYYTTPDRINSHQALIGPFQAKCLKTGKVVESETISGLSALINIRDNLIYESIIKVPTKSNRGYLFKVAADVWPETFDETSYDRPHQIKVTNLETGEDQIFPSLRKVCSFTGGDKRTVKDRLKSGKAYGVWCFEEIVDHVSKSTPSVMTAVISP